MLSSRLGLLKITAEPRGLPAGVTTSPPCLKAFMHTFILKHNPNFSEGCCAFRPNTGPGVQARQDVAGVRAWTTLLECWSPLQLWAASACPSPGCCSAGDKQILRKAPHWAPNYPWPLGHGEGCPGLKLPCSLGCLWESSGSVTCGSSTPPLCMRSPSASWTSSAICSNPSLGRAPVRYREAGGSAGRLCSDSAPHGCMCCPPKKPPTPCGLPGCSH